jgi:hypothetical protein
MDIGKPIREVEVKPDHIPAGKPVPERVPQPELVPV